MQGAGAGTGAPRQRGSLPKPRVEAVLPTELSTILAGLALLFAAAGAFFAYRALQYASTRVVGNGRIAEIELEMAALDDSVKSLTAQIRKLRSRVTMRENRVNGKAEPEPVQNDKHELRERYLLKR